MRRFLPIAFIVLFATPQSAFAQQAETLRFSGVLYFDCSVSSRDEPQEVHNLDVSYLVYADRPSEPQVNFFDPTKLITQKTGWAPKGNFALSRHVSDGRFYVWLGRFAELPSPLLDATIELTPTPGKAFEGTISLVRFMESGGRITTQEFTGNCQNLSGKAAWDRYQNGGPK